MIVWATGAGKNSSKNASKQLRAFGYKARAKRSDAGKRKVIKPRGSK